MLRVPNGSRLFFGYAEHAAGATLSLLGGSDTATFTGNVNNSGTFQTGNDGLGNNTVTVTGTLTNNAGGTLGLYGSGDAMNVNAFSNAGAVTVGAGTTLTVTGTANGYNQSAGTTTVDGTLTAKGTSGIIVTGGTILGSGTLNGDVSVGGSGTSPTISVGDAGQAGLLKITGTYTQLSTGTLTSPSAVRRWARNSASSKLPARRV